jgi:hypothetical protein
MASKTSTDRVIAKARELVEATPDGVRYSELHKRIVAEFPEIPPNTVHGALHRFRNDLPDGIYLPARGLYKHVKFQADEDQKVVVTATKGKKLKEEDFYEPFADWLVNELEECTKAISVGGNTFRDKWGTPDVIGIREAKRSDIIKPPTEIVAAEIKLEIGGLITAFGQACAYKLFAHRSYIVVPRSASEDDISRLDSLARIFGIGLILFSADDAKHPDFSIRARAARHEPDIFYVNRYLKLIEDELF